MRTHPLTPSLFKRGGIKGGEFKIALSGYYGYHNTGDEAILEAICARLSNYRIEVLSAGNRFNLKAIADCDLFISGGGGLLQDVTSAQSFYYYLGLLWLAKKMGKKTCVFSQSIGPVKSLFHRNLLKRVLSKIDLLTVRDQNSMDLLQRIGLPAEKLVLTADPTFLLSTKTPRPCLGQAKKTIGVALRDWKLGDEKIDLISQALERIQEEFNAEILMVPFQWPQDKAIAERYTKFRMLDKPLKPKEMIELIGGLDLLIGMRLHALIFAVIANTPCVGISYDPKVLSFMQEIGAPCLELELLSADSILSAAKSAKIIISSQKSSMIDRAEKAFILVESSFKSI